MEAPPLSTAPPLTTLAVAAATAVETDAVDTAPRYRLTESSESDPMAQKIRLMCSYGGQIIPRPHDKVLCYVGGDTRIIVVHRHISLSDLMLRLSRDLLYNRSFSLKYQLPSEDLDSLISVDNNEDLENMVDEYDRLSNGGGGMSLCRFRLFLFPKSHSSSENLRSGAVTIKSKDSVVESPNGKSIPSSINCLLGLDDDSVVKAEKAVSSQTEAAKIDINGDSDGNSNCVVRNHDLHLISDSPFPDSSDSATNSPPLNNLSHVSMKGEDSQKIGLSGSVALNVNAPPSILQIQKGNGGSLPAEVAVVTGEADPTYLIHYRSDNGVQLALEIQPQLLPQLQQKLSQTSDSQSPDSVSSESGIANPSSRQSQAAHEEQQPHNQIPPTSTHVSSSNPHETETREQYSSQIQEPQGYVVASQYDQNHPHLQQLPHFVQSTGQFIPSRPVPVPIASYYPIFPSQQQQHSHQPIYLLPSGQNHAYSLPCYGELGPAFHHPSQSIPHNQMYYAPLPPQMVSQFRTLTSSPAIVVPNVASQPHEIKSWQP